MNDVKVYRANTGTLLVGLVSVPQSLYTVTRIAEDGHAIDVDHVHLMASDVLIERADLAWLPAVGVWQQRWLDTLYEHEQIAITAYRTAHVNFQRVLNAT